MSLEGPVERLLELPGAPEDAWWTERVKAAPGGAVLYLGAGSGRGALSLAAACDELVAVESDPALARLLTRRSGAGGPVDDRLRALEADPATLDLGRDFGLVVVPPASVNGCEDPRRRIAIARAAGRHCRPDGDVVFEVLDPFWLASAEFGAEGHLDTAAGRIHTTVSEPAFDVWEQRASATIVHRFPDGQTIRDRFRATALYPRELRALAYQAGMEITQRGVGRRPGEPRTWRLVARRQDGHEPSVD